MTLIIKRRYFRLETRRLSILYATQHPLSEPRGRSGWAGIVTWNATTVLTYNTYASAAWKREKGKVNNVFDALTRREA